MKNPFLRTHISNLIVIASLALMPAALAVDPPPDGGYPNRNTAEGENALFSLDTSQGVDNTAIGFNALFSNTIGYSNTAVGSSALFTNTAGYHNTAIGDDTLYKNLGSQNTAIGSRALYRNFSGINNTAIGFDALYRNDRGIDNTATGTSALYSNKAGYENTADGSRALYHNKRGNNNTAIGFDALYWNIAGYNNAANGSGALYSNNYGNNNTAIGIGALSRNTTGSNNIALGGGAGNNLTAGSNNIDIGNQGVDVDANTIRIGTQETQTATFIAGISGVIVAGGVGVIIDTNGHLGTVVSSERFKDNIQPMNKASEAILALEPVTFRYKKELDPDANPQFGLVAEDVEKVNPDLVARDADGKAYTVRYEAVNAMLLNEFLKEHRKGEQQDRRIEELEATLEQLQSALKAQATQIQKVSDQLGAQAPAPRVVAND